MTESVTPDFGEQSTGDATDPIRTLLARTEHGTVGVLERLALSAAKGDRRSTDMLLELVQPLAVRYCRAQLGRHEHSFTDADDVAQEICLAVFAALPLYRSQHRPFLAFMYDIAKDKISNARRAADRDRAEPVATMPEEPGSEIDPEHWAMRDVRAAQVASLRQILPGKQWEILMLRVVVGLSVQETADAVGMPSSAVRGAQTKALARLRLTAARWSLR